jgi:putative FmdB family regulatory protein
MPTYTYQCKKCEATVDHFHGINAKPRIKCEECGSGCKRLIGTGAGIIFKGSGFYETDYKQKSGKPSESGKSESKSDKGESKSSKSESKSSDSGDSGSTKSKTSESSSKKDSKSTSSEKK